VIREFLEKEFFITFGKKSEDISLVFVGKKLDLKKRFIDELVEDNSEIICIDNKGGFPEIIDMKPVYKSRR
jgi:hypothetical protein